MLLKVFCFYYLTFYNIDVEFGSFQVVKFFFFFENSIFIHILDSHACNILFVFTTFVLWEAHFDFDLIRVLLDQFCKIYIFPICHSFGHPFFLSFELNVTNL